MKSIIVVGSDEHSEAAAVHRIMAAMANEGYLVTWNQAIDLWQKYSESMAAGWMALPETDGELLECIRPFFIVK